MKTMTLVMRESNTCDGNGPLVPLCLVPSKEYAQLLVASRGFGEKYGIQGTPGGDYLIREIPVYESFAELHAIMKGLLP